ncbi:MAG: CinA family nicotinamide mononucleotide deamidase-related protein [Planctomycetes bacterium]|nr:CinA family nicotinamide mononucleotide deamidase-related protein [Planctomycetota bacterium]
MRRSRSGKSESMMKLTRAAILSVGDELLGGRTINTNAPYMAQRLTDAGFLVVATDTVGDDEFAIADSLKSLAGRADAVVVTGGLGPTPDDVTREALAGAAGKLLVPDRTLKAQVMEKAGGKAPRRNARMARVPEGAVILPNPVGMAAGLRVEMGGTPVYALPGVPLELEAIFEQSVLPDMKATFAGTKPMPSRVLRVFGLREAEVAEKLGELLDRARDPVVGVNVRDGIITITITGASAEQRASDIRKRLGPYVFGEGDQTLAGVVLGAMKERGLTLALAESITGGMLASLVVDQAGASQVLKGSIVAYVAEAKHELLDVPKTVLSKEGTVSEETALRMARAARKKLSADVGIATTGVAGPDLDEKGTPTGRGFVAIVGPKGEAVEKVSCRGDRNAVRRRFAWIALDLLRHRLLG